MEDNGFESINVIPFIDIMLVLLTIVLTTSTFIATGAIAVHLPEAAADQSSIEQCINLEIDQAGQLYFESRPILLDALGESLTGHPRQTPVLIRADRSIPLQQFVDVMDRVKQLGFNKVSLQTEVRQ